MPIETHFEKINRISNIIEEFIKKNPNTPFSKADLINKHQIPVNARSIIFSELKKRGFIVEHKYILWPQA